MVTIHELEQRSDEWFSIKKQNPFSSSKAQAIGNQGAGLETLIWESLVSEFSIAEKPNFTNEHIERGNELEEIVRYLYEMETGISVSEVGFITNDKYEMAGASTDGLFDDGLLEIKCFEDKKHLKLIHELKKTGSFSIESQYDWQIQMELLITEKDFADYVCFNPNFENSLLIKRVLPDEKKQQKIVEGLKKGVELYKKIKEELK